jgi:hypothetical protein
MVIVVLAFPPLEIAREVAPRLYAAFNAGAFAVRFTVPV